MIIAGIRYRPDLYMGYHIVPGACAALIAGKLFGRPSCYQVTGAPLGIIGGFPETVGEGGIFLRPSGLLEAMALSVVRKFNYIVVRGNKAREYLKSHHIRCPIDIITGSVNCNQHLPRNSRDIHLIYIGRLSPIKQLDRFITILKAVSRIIPSVKAAIVGDGPLIEGLQKLTDELGLQKNVEFLGKRKDVEEILSRSKIFVLTSKSEGLSIAMAEAMAAGTVPVVADVGELGDLVTDGVNGYLIEPNNINEYTKKIVLLLQDQALWDQYSRRAFEDAKRYCDIEVITGKWRRLFRQCVNFSPGVSIQETVK
jgi:glycosyltransferase involved in cell wall biosynthesis